MSWTERARMAAVRPSLPRCRPLTLPARGHQAQFRITLAHSCNQNNLAAQVTNPAPGQSSPADAPATRPAAPTANPNRRAVLLRGAALCALATPITAPPFGRPAAAALVDEDVATSVFEAVSPSVASIAVVRPVGGVTVREVIGSGVVWDAVGPHVLTNFHIVPPLQGSSTRLEVTVQDVSSGAFVTLPARVAGTDSLHDLAVLRLLPPPPPQQQQQQPSSSMSSLPSPGSGGSPQLQLQPEGGGGVGDGYGGAAQTAAGMAAAAGLPVLSPIRVAAAGDLRVGQSVYALGCIASDPAAPTRTLAAGLVSGLGRSIPSPVGARIYGVVQTEAVVNAANSGGPLVDSLGRLVGLSTAVGAAASSTARGSGVSFALPADLLLDLVPKIIVYGNPYGKK
ncbi:hypothetical protein PLESTB_001075600 [Pleodorina starrii]|uniref:Uncharacterized protein n=1 Tax=Pleodorina starrii TaxID=330485 RepID=A0A9W6BRG6_9CHLO|nr:hypothetical protein PLESTM_001183400 [Pleodorina starrii]GLC56166.1 hypothetical protein PLESTB_001075600 [Pleodorina starrii]GLC74949.1 hypothetical protein PLESTF_001576200 [Pleodorina starrii]